jgi:tripartite-type tricarboxylate transporter receptor subunit TctC
MLAGCCMIHTSASAEQFPSRVVKFLVPQAAGGATDVFARKLAQMLSERWGQPIIVENRAGAAGASAPMSSPSRRLTDTRCS